MHQNKNICIYMPTASYLTWWAEIVAINQWLYLKKYWYDITFISLNCKNQTNKFKSLKKSNIKIAYLTHKTINKKILKNHDLSHKYFHELYLSLWEQLYLYLLNNKFDIVINHYSPAWLFVPSSMKSCMLLHGTPTSINESDIIWVEKSTYKVAVSESVKIWWKNLLDRRTEIKVVHNWINPDEFHYTWCNHKDIDIFFVGRNIEIKWIQYIVQAAHYLKDTHHMDLNIVIGGTWPYQDTLKSLVRKYKLNNISFPWYIPEDKLNDYYNRSKIVTLPSYEKEWVLTTMLEAASSGCAIITCKCCWMKDFIIDGYNGIFSKKKDSRDLWKKIKKLLDDELLRNYLWRNAEKTILNGRTWDNSIQNFIDIINK